MKKYDTYKDSGIEWIGKIPEHWDIVKLKWLTSVKRGASPRPIADTKYFDENGDFAWVRISDVTASGRYLEKTTERLSELGVSLSVKQYPGDLFLSIAGSVGKPIITKIKCCIHDGFVWFPDLKINSEFLYYLFQTGLPFGGLGKIGTQLNLNTETIGGIVIPYLSDVDYSSIVSFLDHKTTQIDTLIEKKEQLVEKLTLKRQAVINEAVTKGLNPDVPMKDSGIEWLGEVPEHWRKSKLKYIVNLQGRIGYRGYTVNDLVSEGEGALTLGAKHISVDNKIYLKSPEFISWDKYYESPEIMVQKGDILLTQRGTLGKVALLKEHIGEATINPSMVLLNQISCNNTFLYYYFNSNMFTEWIKLSNTATAVPMISQAQLSNIDIVMPSLNEQSSIASLLDHKTTQIDILKEKINTSIEKLKFYRQSLISEAVTGKIDLRDWKEIDSK